LISYHYRITKYQPALRDEHGAFRGDDWTSVSDIGAAFNDRKLTTSEYLAVEAAHLVAVTAFAEESGVDSLRVEALNFGSGWDEGQDVGLLEVAEVVRANLREQLDCQLTATDRFHVHVGFDYYVYVGSHRACDASVERARRLGLFVDENFPSPQLAD
jgi:hypothetical protein